MRRQCAAVWGEGMYVLKCLDIFRLVCCTLCCSLAAQQHNEEQNKQIELLKDHFSRNLKILQ